MTNLAFTVTEGVLPVSDGLTISYTDYRPANDTGAVPLVYLPGFMRTARDFDHVAPRFAAERRVITIDTRGRGKGGRSPDPAHYHFDRLIDDVWKLADHLDVGRMVLVGLALGAFMGWRMAASCPRRIAGVVANDSGTETSSPGGKKMIANADHGLYSFGDAVAKLRAANAKNFLDFSASDWRQYARQIYADNGSGSWVRDFDSLYLEELTRFKSDIASFWQEFVTLNDIPVLILHGEFSEYLSREHAEKMAAAVARGKVVHIQGRGHPLLLDEPASLAAIRMLLAECDQVV